MQYRNDKMIISSQIRAGRAALGWSAAKLASQCGLSLRTVQSIENNEKPEGVRKSSMIALKATLEAAGIEFIGAPDDGPGIRVRPAH